jgi:hypothetical protein
MLSTCIDLDSMQAARGSSGVQDIHLENCEVDQPMLVAMIRSSRGLKSLVLRQHNAPAHEAFTISALGDALRESCRETLENLELGFRRGTPRNRSLGSLQDFPRLKQISSSTSILLPPTKQLGAVLPPSLASLSLSIDPESVESGWDVALVQLLESKRETVPFLEELYVKGCMTMREQEVIQKSSDAAEVALTSSVVNILPRLAPGAMAIPFDEFIPLWMPPDPAPFFDFPADLGDLPLFEIDTLSDAMDLFDEWTSAALDSLSLL